MLIEVGNKALSQRRLTLSARQIPRNGILSISSFRIRSLLGFDRSVIQIAFTGEEAYRTELLFGRKRQHSPLPSVPLTVQRSLKG